MIDKIKQEAMRRGMRLMSNPKVMKMMADPRVMQAISQGFALKGRISSEIDAHMRNLAGALHLATKDEVQDLQRTLRQMETKVSVLSKQVEGD